MKKVGYPFSTPTMIYISPKKSKKLPARLLFPTARKSEFGMSFEPIETTLRTVLEIPAKILFLSVKFFDK